MIGIPKIMSHIWIGPLLPPTRWMGTWKEKHPDWEYRLYDNKFLNEFDFKTRAQIDEYLKRGLYAGVADLMRLEILYAFGGYIAGADSICLHNVEELLDKACPYVIYENEFCRGKLVSPVIAAPPSNEFVGALVEILAKTKPEELYEPWVSTGNLFTALQIEALKPDIVIFPSHYLIPVHYTGVIYEGPGKVYAKQMFGCTQGLYARRPGGSLFKAIAAKRQRLAEKKYRKAADERQRAMIAALFTDYLADE